MRDATPAGTTVAGSDHASDARTDTHEAMGSTSYELFILLISIMSIVNLVLALVLTGDAAQVVAITDGILTVFFLGDFAFRLRTSRPRRRYLVNDWGWADLLAIFPLMRIFRLFRLVRVARHLRRFGMRRMLDEVASNRSTSAFGLTIFLVLLVVEIAGTTIVSAEAGHPDANIQNGSDAVWWAYVTITTVGYGDRFPVTDQGRILGVLLLTSGVALFSVLTGFVANFFLGPRSRDADDAPPLPLRPIDPRGDLAALVRLLDEQEDRSRELRRRIGELERWTPAEGDAASPAAGGDAEQGGPPRV